MDQSKVYTTFTHSQIYQPHLQPPIELVLRKMKIKNIHTEDPKEVDTIMTDPLMVFDHAINKVRKTNEKDGLFFYLTHRPSNKVVNTGMRSLLIQSHNFGPQGSIAVTDDQNRVRTLRVLICVTMTNESMEDLDITLNGIHENLKYFTKDGCCDEDVGVVVLIDGLDKMHESMYELFTKKDKLLRIPLEKRLSQREKIFKTPTMKNASFPRDSIYCYQLTMKPEGHDGAEVANYLNTFLCVKLQSSGRLSSHLWFFRGFCEMFNPDYCILMKGGVRAGNKSIYEMFRTFEGDDQIGGICGWTSLTPEPIIDKFGVREDQDVATNIDSVTNFMSMFFDIQKAQVFENIFTYLINKPFESFFGFLTVLDSNFSGYRWDALRKRKDCKNILDDVYLKTVIDPDYVNSKFFSWDKATLYLAEERMLCLEIFTRKNYILKYIPTIRCSVDPQKHLTSFLNEKRKSINREWFSMRYILQICWKEVLLSRHSCFRQIFFFIYVIFKMLEMLTTYLSPAIFVSVFYYVVDEFAGQYRIQKYGSVGDFSGGFLLLIVALMGSILFYSLLYRVKDRPGKFHFYSTLLSLLFLGFVAFVVYLIIMILFVRTDTVIGYMGVGYVNQTETVPEMFRTTFKYFAPKYPEIPGNLTVGPIYQVIRVDYVIPIFYADWLMWAVIGNIGLYVLVILLSFNQVTIYEVLTHFKDYLYYWPVFKYVSIVYAFSNIDELTYDTFEGGVKIDKGSSTFMKTIEFKLNYMYKWLILNMGGAYALIVLFRSYIFKKWFIIGVAFYFSAGVLFKCSLALLHQLKYITIDSCLYYYQMLNKKVHYYVKTKETNNYLRNHIKAGGGGGTSLIVSQIGNPTLKTGIKSGHEWEQSKILNKSSSIHFQPSLKDKPPGKSSSPVKLSRFAGIARFGDSKKYNDSGLLTQKVDPIGNFEKSIITLETKNLDEPKKTIETEVEY